ncbi:hypothetical protein LIER_22108 [Lithospermum erythrorhizon]|uniref:Reverse transcriptase domain-containing protein n=1 Tax=Lithospermum erythrorhizon TaxID=34254 RepID=A0AAV3QST8_LITER
MREELIVPAVTQRGLKGKEIIVESPILNEEFNSCGPGVYGAEKKVLQLGSHINFKTGFTETLKFFEFQNTAPTHNICTRLGSVSETERVLKRGSSNVSGYRKRYHPYYRGEASISPTKKHLLSIDGLDDESSSDPMAKVEGFHRDVASIHTVATKLYEKLFTAQNGGNCFTQGQVDTNFLEFEATRRMDFPFTREEVKNYLCSMNDTKAPGPDGIPAKLYQHFWDTVSEKLCNMTLNFLNNGIFLKKFNFTLITLVPKVDRPICMAQFRPIALCNIPTKFITKTLDIRLKKFLPTVISETQIAFVPNRLITDNVLIAYEAHHVIKHRNSWEEDLILLR